MLLTTPAPDVRDHLSDREISTALFLPAQEMSKAGELPRTLAVSQGSKYQYYTRKCKVKKNILKEFREAVQFKMKS